ncbi:MAG: T9SS type A sorting domain-containing protein [Bacteroidota bacterium]
MKNVLLLCGLCLQLGAVSAQSYSSPESVVYDAANNRYLISNNGNNRILARSASGVLSIFTTNISSGPHGLEIVGNTVYACDGSSVKGFDLTTAALVFNVNVGGTFLNGICTDGVNTLFVTDFTAKKVYKIFISTQVFSTFVTGLGPSPNGIIYDGANNRIVWVNWGSNAPITQALLSDSSVSTVTPTTLGNCDGIVRDGAGNYYVSAWSTNSIWRFTNTFGSPVQVVSALSSPADIYYNLANDTLVSPNSGNNTVTFHYMGSMTGANGLFSGPAFSLYPNPCNDQTAVHLSPGIASGAYIRLYDLSGAEVAAMQVPPAGEKIVIGTQSLAPGIYLVQLITEKGRETRKLIVTR